MGLSIAIDGPSGAGKSTIARLLAKTLGYIYIDTGAMYRAVALYCIQKGVSASDEEGVKKLLDSIHIEIKYRDGLQHIYLNGADVSERIRSQDVADGSSKVATIQLVREKLVALQRKAAENGSVVMDGRDIGTRVLPQAEVKIFLTASVEERVKRRMAELRQKGLTPEPAHVKAEIEERDYRDTHRAVDPLVQASDAIYIDSSGMTAAEVVAEITAHVKKVV